MLDNLGNLERTHSGGELRAEHAGQTVTLMGWAARRRDFGPLTFIDLRDREGITQVVCNEETAPDAHAKGKQVRTEYVVAVTGEVVLRAENLRNPKLATGEIEVQAREIRILNDAKNLPFQLAVAGSESLAAEDVRLKYRYLDLRRPQMQHYLQMRHRAVLEIHRYMDAAGFLHIETPILLKSTPEGARDFVVPSRIYPGKFFALPQSPQILKQLCMISGLDKYYQIARCFRDEDLRADRQPEFTQLDVELSFASEEIVYRIIEGVFTSVMRLIGVELPNPFPRLSYAEAMACYGSDKPDLRYSLELKDLSGCLSDTTFAPFAAVLENGGQVKGIVVPDGVNSLSRKQLDELQEFVKRYGASGLAWIKRGDEVSSSLLKVLGPETIERMCATAGANQGDAVLVVAGRKKVVAASLGALRVELARRLQMIPTGVYKPLIVTNFPMFELNPDTGRYDAMHHPFTSPVDEDLPLLRRALEDGETQLLGQIRAKAYDAVMNGSECAGGSIRIHRRDVQNLIFKALGLTRETARERFGFFLDALEYGTPPHGGFAAGIERLCMILCGTENIRDVMAFPKTASATDLMLDAPGPVDAAQMNELKLKLME